MESANPAKAWRSFLFSKTVDVLFPQDLQTQLYHMRNFIRFFVGIFVQGTSVRRVRVHAYKRVRNGKTEFVKAHWRQYWR